MARCGCVSVCNCLILGVDSECLATDVTGQGTVAVPYNIEVNPIISDDAGNSLECRADGFYASANVTVDTDNTDCIALSISGNGTPATPYVITATPIIAPEDNGIECTPAGLLVFPSADAGNTLTFGTDDRLYVPAADVTIVGDTDNDNCVNITVVEAPLNTFTLEGSVLVDGVTVTCGPGGLSSPTVVNVIDNDPTQNQTVGPPDTITFDCVPIPIAAQTLQPGPGCIDIVGDTCNGFTVRLGLSDDPDQMLECRGDGLFVCQVESATQAAGTAIGPLGPFNGTALLPNPFVRTAPVCINFVNPSTCRAMAVRWLIQEAFGEAVVDGGKLEAGIEFSLDGGGTFGQSGSVVGPFDNGANSGGSWLNSDTGLFITIPAGGAQNVCIRGFVQGVGTVNGRFTSLSINLNLDGRAA